MAQWVPPPLPAELMVRRRGPLVGRAAELAAFEQAWERVEGGNRQAVFIGGEPGAGKTRLAAEVAGTLADHGVAVLVGSSTADADFRTHRSPRLDRLLMANSPGSMADRWRCGTAAAAAVNPGGPASARYRPGRDVGMPDGRFSRPDRFPATPGDRSPDRVDPRRPALGAAAHPCDARTGADRLRRCPLLVVATFRTTEPDRSDELITGWPNCTGSTVSGAWISRGWTPRRSPSS